ncbi:NADP-dependent oxidoreductase [Leptolyngbya sp. FACHB-541]|uniref:NADP-dependent oxidoreductase n=1 Tax=Leptolyngbya sp. FACHB-541 TaxID=2692810 RepID=UPI001687C4C4|nr:NADP-dependent oxidoreductase [Leptolyngbya sp. FACHB-541]MBD1998066.1 NADP-dependent oxidoreductase [Leptolyngbya sp. FACHB-541]
MKAIVLDHYGTPDVLYLTEMPDPVPGTNEVLVRVYASSVNPVDIGVRQGRVLSSEPHRFPMILGWDAAGIVEDVGDGVTDFVRGDRVVLVSEQPSSGRGTHAELVAVPSRQIVKLPETINFVTAAAIPLAGITALQAVKALSLSPGQLILINNPLGAVGGFASQIARQLGLKVISPISPHLAEEARTQGVEWAVPVDQSLNNAVREVVPEGVDGAIDLVGADIAHQTFSAVKNGGAYTTVLPEWWKPGGPYTEDRAIKPIVVENKPNQADLSKLVEWLNLGVLSPRIEQTFSLAQTAEAHRLHEKPGLTRKLIIENA